MDLALTLQTLMGYGSTGFLHSHGTGNGICKWDGKDRDTWLLYVSLLCHAYHSISSACIYKIMKLGLLGILIQQWSTKAWSCLIKSASHYWTHLAVRITIELSEDLDSWQNHRISERSLGFCLFFLNNCNQELRGRSKLGIANGPWLL